MAPFDLPLGWSVRRKAVISAFVRVNIQAYRQENKLSVSRETSELTADTSHSVQQVQSGEDLLGLLIENCSNPFVN